MKSVAVFMLVTLFYSSTSVGQTKISGPSSNSGKASGVNASPSASPSPSATPFNPLKWTANEIKKLQGSAGNFDIIKAQEKGFDSPLGRFSIGYKANGSYGAGIKLFPFRFPIQASSTAAVKGKIFGRSLGELSAIQAELGNYNELNPYTQIKDDPNRTFYHSFANPRMKFSVRLLGVTLKARESNSQQLRTSLVKTMLSVFGDNPSLKPQIPIIPGLLSVVFDGGLIKESKLKIDVVPDIQIKDSEIQIKGISAAIGPEMSASVYAQAGLQASVCGVVGAEAGVRGAFDVLKGSIAGSAAYVAESPLVDLGLKADLDYFGGTISGYALAWAGWCPACVKTEGEVELLKIDGTKIFSKSALLGRLNLRGSPLYYNCLSEFGPVSSVCSLGTPKDLTAVEKSISLRPAPPNPCQRYGGILEASTGRCVLGNLPRPDIFPTQNYRLTHFMRPGDFDPILSVVTERASCFGLKGRWSSDVFSREYCSVREFSTQDQENLRFAQGYDYFPMGIHDRVWDDRAGTYTTFDLPPGHYINKGKGGLPYLSRTRVDYARGNLNVEVQDLPESEINPYGEDEWGNQVDVVPYCSRGGTQLPNGWCKHNAIPLIANTSLTMMGAMPGWNYWIDTPRVPVVPLTQNPQTLSPQQKAALAPARSLPGDRVLASRLDSVEGVQRARGGSLPQLPAMDRVRPSVRLLASNTQATDVANQITKDSLSVAEAAVEPRSKEIKAQAPVPVSTQIHYHTPEHGFCPFGGNAWLDRSGSICTVTTPFTVIPLPKGMDYELDIYRGQIFYQPIGI
jgi:hypothetical protein